MDTSDTNARRDGEEPIAPAKLVAALKEPPARRVFVPPTLDAAVLKAARQHLVKPGPLRVRLLRPWILWPTVATACIALAGLVYLASRPALSHIAREDINHDGRVDILDAFQLARETQAGAKADFEHDLDGDGVVNRRDVELIAAQAVALPKGGKS